jgi:hypothetical protein
MTKADRHVKNFIVDAKAILEKYDKKIHANITSFRQYEHFYREDEWKGIGFSGTTETIIRFLLSIELSRKYAIWPEMPYDRSPKKHADLGLFINPKQSEEDAVADITIELKWCQVKKDKKAFNFDQSSLNILEADLRKLRDFSKSPNNYVLQMTFRPILSIITRQTLEKSIKNSISGHITKNHHLRVISLESFKTCSTNPLKKDYAFWLICWKLTRK